MDEQLDINRDDYNHNGEVSAFYLSKFIVILFKISFHLSSDVYRNKRDCILNFILLCYHRP